MRKKAYALAALALGVVVSTPAGAALFGFGGPFDPSTWTTSFVGDVAPPGAADNGSVNTSGAPTSIVITGGDDPSNPDGSFNSCSNGGPFGCEIRYTHSVLELPIAFNWSYLSLDSSGGPQFDFFGVLLNGVEMQLSDSGGLASQSGSFSTDGLAISSFGFYVATLDGAAGPAAVTITAFQTPEPTSLALVALAMGPLVLRRRTRS